MLLVEKQEEHYIGEQVECIEGAVVAELRTAAVWHTGVEELLVEWVFHTYCKTSPYQLMLRNGYKS